jgi:hypothetical protein
MYNFYTKERIVSFLYARFSLAWIAAVGSFWLAAAGAGAANAQNTIELRGRQPDHPMMRGGQPLVVDGQTVRIAGAEFIFRISPTGPDSLVKRTMDGRVFEATGNCTEDNAQGWQCSFADTAGNPMTYLLTLKLDTSSNSALRWRCIGRNTEPSFDVEEIR